VSKAHIFAVGGFIALGLLSNGGFPRPAFAQCYPGLVCPDNREAPTAPPAHDATPTQQQPNEQSRGAAQPRAGRSLWTHNGSLVSLAANGDKRSFYYEDPREGMRAAGAERGALLFQGVRQGTSYAGTAYIFHGRCGAISYAVRGGVSLNERRISLEGQAPSQVDQNCQVTAYKRDTLIFDFSSSE
jgi:hypothetical protein